MSKEHRGEHASIKFPFDKVGSVIFKFTHDKTDLSCATITASPYGIRFNDKSMDKSPPVNKQQPQRSSIGTHGFDIEPNIECYLGKIGGAPSVMGNTTTWVYPAVGNMPAEKAREEYKLRKEETGIYRDADNICPYVFNSDNYERVKAKKGKTCQNKECKLIHPLSPKGTGMTKEMALARIYMSELKKVKFAKKGTTPKPIPWCLKAFAQAIHRHSSSNPTIPSNALTVMPSMPSNAVTVAPSVIPAASMGGAPVQIVSALSDGILEINIQGWIARSKREDIMKQIQSHSVRNCPNNHCTSYHQKSQDCDCACQVKNFSTCIQCPKFAEGVMAKFEFAAKDAQRALYCGIVHTEASEKSMMRGLRCITSSSTAPVTASPSNTTNRPLPLTFDQMIELFKAQGMASRLDASTVNRIRNLH